MYWQMLDFQHNKNRRRDHTNVNSVTQHPGSKIIRSNIAFIALYVVTVTALRSAVTRAIRKPRHSCLHMVNGLTRRDRTVSRAHELHELHGAGQSLEAHFRIPESTGACAPDVQAHKFFQTSGALVCYPCTTGWIQREYLREKTYRFIVVLPAKHEPSSPDSLFISDSNWVLH